MSLLHVMSSSMPLFSSLNTCLHTLLFSFCHVFLAILSYLAVCKLLFQSNTPLLDFTVSDERGRSNQWNLLLKWLVGTKPCNLPGLGATQTRATAAHRSLHKAVLTLCCSPCCLLHILWTQKISSSQTSVHVSISSVPPHHSRLSHSVGHAVSNKELKPGSDAICSVSSLLPVDWVSRWRLSEMNNVNPVESFNAFKPRLQHDSLWIFVMILLNTNVIILIMRIMIIISTNHEQQRTQHEHHLKSIYTWVIIAITLNLVCRTRLAERLNGFSCHDFAKYYKCDGAWFI